MKKNLRPSNRHYYPKTSRRKWNSFKNVEQQEIISPELKIMRVILELSTPMNQKGRFERAFTTKVFKNDSFNKKLV
jgi:hypothetical protein